MSQTVKITPMLQQYLEIKQGHPDAILFYRMGDFYEMFFEYAIVASKILGIALTSRNNKDEAAQGAPLCGFILPRGPDLFGQADQGSPEGDHLRTDRVSGLSQGLSTTFPCHFPLHFRGKYCFSSHIHQFEIRQLHQTLNGGIGINTNG